MSYPENPETLVIQNQYYPNGLKQIDIWNYYQKNKQLILQQVKGRELIVFFATNKNTTTVIRKRNGSPIILTKDNYDTIVSGRTLSFHSTMNNIENFGIVDIDINNFETAKYLTTIISRKLLTAPFIKDVGIRFTGKESFHIVCYLKRKLYINGIKELLKNFLKEKKDDDDDDEGYTIQYKRTDNTPNIDLSSNKFKGGFITSGSLSVLGLRCIEMSLPKLATFKKHYAKLWT